MIKIIDNTKLEKKNIFRVESPKDSRLEYIRLDKNERYENHNIEFFNKLKKQISSDLISAYPEFSKVYRLLSKNLKVNKNNILLTAGSDQALKNTFELYYKKNKKVITIDPTFAMVDIYCKIFKTKQIKISHNKNLKINTSELINSINNKVCLIIIANPNSPTGSFINQNELDLILKKALKYNVKVLIDEAYYEFAKYNCSKKIKKYNNLIIIRTFSKIFGLAGLRCGYVLSNKTIIKEFSAIKPMYEINSVAVKALELLLPKKKILNSYLRLMREGEKFAIKFCKDNNYQFIKCYANFFHISFDYDPNKIQNHLIKKKVLVKGGPGIKVFKNYLRISFAEKRTLSKILNIIKSFLTKKR